MGSDYLRIREEQVTALENTIRNYEGSTPCMRAQLEDLKEAVERLKGLLKNSENAP